MVNVSDATGQVGAVKVGGDWIASNLIAGVNSIDGRIGDGNDVIAGTPAPGTFSKIGSITIGGHVLGVLGDPSKTFGFGAGFIGSFKVAGTPIPLKPGPHTDTFAGAGLVGNAIAVGQTAANVVDDGFAVHVFEV